ncbi:MAG: tetratricopeptide repeat protein [Desulfobacterales bacterium]|nr:tetratricopeptide repeat protein [Deltaproteobacteria bacterium]NNL75278.1 tetratricopeptide repeat protein [Desulfobacterales bacterium]
MSKKHIAKEKFDEAMADFANHNYGRSIELFSQAIELNPEFSLAIKSRGAAYLRLDKTQEAIADFSTVVEMASDNARAYHLRGLAYEKSGDNAKALEDFNKALELNTEYGAVYYSRANLHHKMGQTELATEDIKMVTHLSEVNIESFANDNNVWRSQHLRLESMYGDDLAMER